MDDDFLNSANEYIGKTIDKNVIEDIWREKYSIKNFEFEEKCDDEYSRYRLEEKLIGVVMSEDYNAKSAFSKLSFNEFTLMLVSLLSIITSLLSVS